MACPDCGLALMHDDFMVMLDSMRVMYGRSIIVNSGYRCAAHNTKVGGSPKSMHLVGRAADLRVGDGRDAYQLIECAIRTGFNGIGIAKTFVHVDTRDKKTVWTYPI